MWGGKKEKKGNCEHKNRFRETVELEILYTHTHYSKLTARFTTQECSTAPSWCTVSFRTDDT